MSETAKATETFCTSLDEAIEIAIYEGLFITDVIGILTVKAQELGLQALGFYDDADSEGAEDED